MAQVMEPDILEARGLSHPCKSLGNLFRVQRGAIGFGEYKPSILPDATQLHLLQYLSTLDLTE